MKKARQQSPYKDQKQSLNQIQEQIQKQNSKEKQSGYQDQIENQKLKLKDVKNKSAKKINAKIIKAKKTKTSHSYLDKKNEEAPAELILKTALNDEISLQECNDYSIGSHSTHNRMLYAELRNLKGRIVEMYSKKENCLAKLDKDINNLNAKITELSQNIQNVFIEIEKMVKIFQEQSIERNIRIQMKNYLH